MWFSCTSCLVEPCLFDSDCGEARAVGGDPVLPSENLGRLMAVSRGWDCRRFGGGAGDCGRSDGIMTADEIGL